MSIMAVALLAVALGMDAFSMAVGLGISGIRGGRIVVISGVVCFFHILMPLAGWTLGVITGNAVGRFAGYFGASVLIFIGFAGLLEIVEEGRIPAGNHYYSPSQPRRQFGMGFVGLLFLAGSVSLDALSVGFSLGTMGGSLWLTVLIFGATAGLMTAGGFLLGRNVGFRLGSKAEIAGALILIIIGIKMLFS